jgi:hypothetical protein
MFTTYPAGSQFGQPAIKPFRDARDAFKAHPTTFNAHALMNAGNHAWERGWIGDATFTREVLEPVRTYLLAGNTPLPEGDRT